MDPRYVLPWALFLILLQSCDAQYASCKEQLLGANSNGDSILSSEEFNVFVRAITGGTIENASSDPATSGVFASHSNNNAVDITGVQSTAPATQQDTVVAFCDDLYNALESHYNIAVSASECIAALQTADKNPANARLNEVEFVVFVGALTGERFGELPARIQTTFGDFAVDGEVRSSSGMSFLQQFCQRTALDVSIELQAVDAPAPPPPTTGPPPPPPAPPVTEEPKQSLERITEEEFAQCRKAMGVADANRDTRMDTNEYVGFVVQLFPDGGLSDTLETIHPLFTSNYDTVKGSDNLIDIGGAKLGTEPTKEQFFNLNFVCAETLQTIKLVRLLSPVATTQPPPATTPPPPVNIISSAFFLDCRSAMVNADLNRNSNMEKTEYPKFLDKLYTGGNYSSVSYDELDPLFRDAFEVGARGANAINITGARGADSPTQVELAFLETVCSEVDSAHKQINRREPPTTATPPSPATTAPPPMTSTPPPPTIPSPTNPPTEDPSFTRCKTSMGLTDVDSNNRLTQTEYVEFLNLMGDNALSDLSFSELHPVLKESFYTLAGSQTGSIDITGARESGTQSDALLFVCAEAVRAISKWKQETSPNGSTPTSSPVRPETMSPSEQNASPVITTCIDPILLADVNSNGILDKAEYASFVHRIANGEGDAPDFDELPYLLRENFEWIKVGFDAVDLSEVSAKSRQGLVYGYFICNRTKDTLDFVSKDSSKAPAVTLVDQCSRSAASSDADDSDSLDNAEFFGFANEMSGFTWKGLSYDELDESLRGAFDKSKSSGTSQIDISAAKLKEVPTSDQISELVAFCENIEEGISTGRKTDAFYQRCKISLAASDADEDTRLRRDEYVQFLYNLKGGTLDEITFDALDDVLKINYELLTLRQDGVDISGLYTDDPTETQIEHVRWICTNVESVIDAVPSDETKSSVMVFNSFIVTNIVGFVQSDLEIGPARTTLEKAYELFVEEQVQLFSLRSPNLRSRRQLKVLGVHSDSTRLYRIDDRTCPSDTGEGVNCQTAYGSFELSLLDEGNPASVSAAYSDELQGAIDKGALQAQLVRQDPKFPISVYGSSLPLRPSSSSQDDKSGISIAILAVILAAAAILICLIAWFACRRASARKFERGLSTKMHSFDDDSRDPDQAQAMTMLMNASGHKPSGTSQRTGNTGRGGNMLKRTSSRMHPQNESGLQRKTSGRKLLGRMNSSRRGLKVRHDDLSYSERVGSDKDSNHSKASYGFCVDDDHDEHSRGMSTIRSGDLGVLHESGFSEEDDESSRISGITKDTGIGTFSEVQEEEKSLASEISWLQKSGDLTDPHDRSRRSGVSRTRSNRSDGSRPKRRPSRFPNRPHGSTAPVPGKQRRRGRRASQTPAASSDIPRHSLSRRSSRRSLASVASSVVSKNDSAGGGRRAPQRTMSEVSQISMDESLHIDDRKAELARELAKVAAEQEIDDEELTIQNHHNSFETDECSYDMAEVAAEQDELDEELTISESPKKRKPEPTSPERPKPEPPGLSQREKSQRNIRNQLESLVRDVVPDELDNITTMLEQFEGNEDELIQTLENMKADNDGDNDSFADEEASTAFTELQQEQSSESSNENEPSEEDQLLEENEASEEEKVVDENVSSTEQPNTEGIMAEDHDIVPNDDAMKEGIPRTQPIPSDCDAATEPDNSVSETKPPENVDDASAESSSEEESEEEEEEETDEEEEEESVLVTLEGDTNSASSITEDESGSYEEDEVGEGSGEESDGSGEEESEESSSYETASDSEESAEDTESTEQPEGDDEDEDEETIEIEEEVIAEERVESEEGGDEDSLESEVIEDGGEMEIEDDADEIIEEVLVEDAEETPEIEDEPEEVLVDEAELILDDHESDCDIIEEEIPDGETVEEIIESDGEHSLESDGSSSSGGDSSSCYEEESVEEVNDANSLESSSVSSSSVASSSTEDS